MKPVPKIESEPASSSFLVTWEAEPAPSRRHYWGSSFSPSQPHSAPLSVVQPVIIYNITTHSAADSDSHEHKYAAPSSFASRRHHVDVSRSHTTRLPFDIAAFLSHYPFPQQRSQSASASAPASTNAAFYRDEVKAQPMGVNWSGMVQRLRGDWEELESLAQLPARSLARTYLVQLFPSAMHLSAVLLAIATFTAVSAFDYTVAVGKDQVTGLPGVGIDPSRTVTTGTNDRLVFHLLSGQHRLVQTSFEAPCTPLGTPGALDSGLQTVPDGVTTFEASNFQSEFPVANSSVIAYFADIGPAVNQTGATQCQQGSTFCVNTDETSSRACYLFHQAALALGAQAGVTTSARTVTPTMSSSSSSMTSSRPVSTASAQPQVTNSQRPVSGAVALNGRDVGRVLVVVVSLVLAGTLGAGLLAA